MIVEVDTDKEFESELSAEIRIKGILKALRIILRVDDGDSILSHASNLMRRIDDRNWEAIEFRYTKKE